MKSTLTLDHKVLNAELQFWFKNCNCPGVSTLQYFAVPSISPADLPRDREEERRGEGVVHHEARRGPRHLTPEPQLLGQSWWLGDLQDTLFSYFLLYFRVLL